MHTKTRDSTEHSKRVNKPNMACKTPIRPTSVITKRNDSNSLKIQCDYFSNESPTEPQAEHASIPPPLCKKQKPTHQDNDNEMLTRHPQGKNYQRPNENICRGNENGNSNCRKKEPENC